MALGFVRPARPEDAAEIARIQLSTWRTAYRRMFPAHILAGLDEAFLASTWLAAIEQTPSPRHRVLIAVEQGESATEVVGFAAAGPADEHAQAPEEPALPDGVAAVTELLVEPRWGRRGHGSRLMAAAVDLARSDGMTRAVCWIPEADTVSREFLLGAGWAADGLVRALDTGSGELREIRLHVNLRTD
jgi:GNAT superfamily N-acetyltransferase